MSISETKISMTCPKLKWKWYRSNYYSQKWSFYWAITWKLLFCGWIKIWGGHFSWWRKTIQGSCWWWNFSEVNFVIKDSKRNKLLGVHFHSAQQNWEICGNDFYIPYWEVETCYNLALQLMIVCIFTHILFSVNKSYFHLNVRVVSVYFSLTM